MNIQTQTVVITPPAVQTVVSKGAQGPRGPQGPISASTDLISSDPGNQLTQGTDDKLYVPAPQLASAQW